MFTRLSYFILFFLLSSPAFAVLNESTKPSGISIYLQQNLPYSGFNAHKQAQGLYVDFWNAWSLKTGISVKFHPYLQQDIHLLLLENNPAVYSGLQPLFSESQQLSKIPLIAIKSDLYSVSSHSNRVSKALVDKQTEIIVGGLLPEAHQLPLLRDKKNIIYQEYPGLLELLLDLYNDKIDALILFNIGEDSVGLLDSLLTTLLNKTSIDGRHNQLFAFLPADQENLFKWLQWGKQFKQLDDKLRIALVEKNQPWWGASATMTRNVLLASGLFFIFILVGRSKRKKDRQFKDVLDSSPYPLVIFALDGNAIFYLNDEVKSLFPFKKKKKKFIFEEAENQLLLSRFINKVSHQSIIENALVRLLVNDTFHDIEIFAKRIHYKRQTAWLCHLKDVTALLSAERKLTEERELLRKVLDSIPEQIAFKSPKGTIIGCNTAWAQANNTTVSHATGRSVADMMTLPEIKKQKQQEATVWTGETYNTQEWIQQNKSVNLSLVNITKVPLYNNKGTIFAILSIDSDITALHNLTKQLKDENLQRKETEKALSKQSVLLSTVFAASYDPIALLDHEGRILGANNSFAKLMNSDPDEMVGKLQSEFLSSDKADWADRQNQEVLASGKPIIFEELLFIGDKKTWYEVHKAPFKDAESHSQGIVIMARDITVRKLTEEKLSSDASDFEQKVLNDQLTNIANRCSFDAHFTKLWQEACDEQEMLSVVMCDIDYFKSYNDNYGHQMGDEALKIIATALQATANEMGCFTARYGGEEFVVIIKGGNATKVFRAVEKLHEAIKQTKVEHLYSDVSRYVTMSMGLSSLFPSDLNTMKILIAEADAALYDAKMSGRDQISVHD
ncbi:transporter substrate-binding domain-containing diguanylate cyclase [Psychromonas hadalis]|uniref:transporter substrate-binding domain-containing diguanylate cyclase n=1 Tax=Psychromonas hadalis TaxID=211669 RepID=UPI0003B35F5C|nr:diguanylate cyclase [Psychromonas hadalis]